MLYKKKILKIVLSSAFFLIVFFSYVKLIGDEKNFYPCMETVKAPVVNGEIITWDGFITEDCWENAIWGESFLIPGTIEKHVEQASFALSYDNNNLYFGAICLKPEAQNAEKSKNNVWQNECVELFVNPSDEPCGVKHMLFDPSGRGLLIADGDQLSLKENGALISVSQDNDRWVLEAAIPLKTLGLKKPKLNSEWSFNVAREHRSTKEKRVTLSSWAYLPETKFMSPERFIKLKFVEKAENQIGKISAPLPLGLPKRLKCSKPGFILDMAESKTKFRDTNINEQVGTPFASDFIAWANPIAGEKLNILFIIELVARDIYELRERMQFANVDYILFGTPFGGNNNQRPFAYNAENVIKKLKGEGHKYDVIVITCAINNKELFDCIEKQVSEGTGLIIFSPRASGGSADLLNSDNLLPSLQSFDKERDHQVLRNWPLDGLANAGPSNKIIKSIGFGSYGKGRILHIGNCIRWTEGLIPFPVYDKNFTSDQIFPKWWESVFSLLMKGILWAGNSELPSGIENCTVNDKTISVKFSAQLKEDMEVTVYWNNKIFDISPSKVKASEGTLEIQVPIPDNLQKSKGINGATLCHVILKENASEETYDWASCVIKKPSDVSIVKAELDKEFYAPDDIPIINLKIKDKSQTPRKIFIKTVLLDNYDRVVSENVIQFDRLSAQILLSLSRSISDRLLLKLQVIDEQNNVLDNKTLKLFVPDNTKFWTDDFVLGVLLPDLFSRPYHNSAEEKILKDIGIRMRVPKQWNATFHNVFGEPHARKGVASHQRSICFNRDRKKVQKNYEEISKGVERNLKNGMIGATMLDEGGISGRAGGYGIDGSDPTYDFCYCPVCVEEFRISATNTYKNIDTANEQWGTSFKSWNEVRPVPLESIQKRKDRNYSLWLDYKFFIEKSYLDCFKDAKKYISSKYPWALLGLTNPGYLGQRTLLSGENYPEWAKAETFSLKYYGSVDATGYGSFITPRTMSATWWGYGAPVDQVKTEPWWTAFNKIRIATWWWAYSCAAVSTPAWSTNNLFSKYCGHTPRSLVLKETAKDLLDGIGKIALDAKRCDREIAMLYSQSSMYVSGAEKKENSYYFRSELNWKRLIRKAGYEFDFVNTTNLDTQLKKYKVLILPYSISLSDDVASEIVKFAKNGGVVIADVMPGVFDGHGKFQNGNGLWEKILKDGKAQNVSFDGSNFKERIIGRGKIWFFCALFRSEADTRNNRPPCAVKGNPA